ncbi:hypothetical protein DSL72_004487 [Monilinia vaccinii-corymbosi]|uniref:Uncharacterized protein n=1 Tax=Monilinia vaccinii-corymbosi TaxID=61207 RepID=A0A8A3P8U2_9HELO|nr:hypothetical protein DSL72_004487 [Monilinia vaccinii-corymbosi]
MLGLSSPESSPHLASSPEESMEQKLQIKLGADTTARASSRAHEQQASPKAKQQVPSKENQRARLPRSNEKQTIPIISLPSSHENHQHFNIPIVIALQDTAQNLRSAYLEPPDPKVRRVMKEVAAAFDRTSHQTQAWIQRSDQTIRKMTYEMEDVTGIFTSSDPRTWTSFGLFHHFFFQQNSQKKFGIMRESIAELNNTNNLLRENYMDLSQKLDHLTDVLFTSQREWNEQIGKESSKFFFRRDNNKIKSLASDLKLINMIRRFSSAARNVVSCANIFNDLALILTFLDKTSRTSFAQGKFGQEHIQEAQLRTIPSFELENIKTSTNEMAPKDDHKNDLIMQDLFATLIHLASFVARAYWTQQDEAGAGMADRVFEDVKDRVVML